MIDGHVHLEKGPLTLDYVRQFVETAAERGIKHLQILDHTHRFTEFAPIYDCYRFLPPQDDWLNHDHFVNSIQDYIDLVEECKKVDWPIKVTYGLEVCYAKSEEEKIKQILKEINYPWDFLVGSVHAVDYLIYDCKWSPKELWESHDVDWIYKKYYEALFDVVKSDIFTQVGHPDTIKMYNYYPTYDLTETYEEFARLCKEHHVKAENNTGASYRYGHKDIGLSDEFLAILKKNGVEMITASDGHYPKDVATNIDKIWDKTMA